MPKVVKTIIKLQIPAGKANPAPPVGTALGPQGLNIMEFCTDFNQKTAHLGNVVVPVEMTVFEDRTYTYITKQPPAANLILTELGIEKGSQTPGKGATVGKLSQAQLKKIAEQKLPDLSARDVDAAMKVIEGTARGMGVEIAKD